MIHKLSKFLITIITIALYFGISNADHLRGTKLVDENGIPYGVAHHNNSIMVHTTEHITHIGHGDIAGSKAKRIIGYNSSVDNAAFDDISELGVNIIPLPTVATAMEVVSDSTADDGSPVGSGARIIEIHGLDSNWNEINELVTMDGTTAVDLSNTYIRINNMHVMSVGTNGMAVGTISLQTDGAGTTWNKISAGGNMSLQCHFTIPANKNGFIVGWVGGAITTKKDTIARIVLQAKVDWDDFSLLTNLYHFLDICILQAGSIERSITLHIKLPPKCDVKISAQRMEGTGVVEASGVISLYYKDI